jgi:hypothetical protein
MHHFVGVCDGGIGDAFVLELHGVGQAFALGAFYVAIMCGSPDVVKSVASQAPEDFTAHSGDAPDEKNTITSWLQD